MKQQTRRAQGPSLLVCASLLLLSSGCPGPGNGPSGPDDEALRQEIEEVAAHLDSESYAAEVTWEEHVVLTYRLALDRDPTPVELAMLSRLRDHVELDRSDVLALALATEDENALPAAASEGVAAEAAGADTNVVPDAYRRFLETHDAASFRPDDSLGDAVSQLRDVPDESLARTLEAAAVETRDAMAEPSDLDHDHPSSEAGVTYETYFGFLHAHSHLSDGEGGALEAYTFARDQGDLDFFGLTDHGASLKKWPWDRKWRKLKKAAEDTHDPGTYVTFWGFEWSNPLLGHVSVINTGGFTHTLADRTMADLYAWLEDRPEGFARFNHPGRYGVSVLDSPVIREFDHFDLEPRAVPQLVGVELFNKDESFDRFYYAGSWDGNPTSYIDLGVQKGWHLGVLGGQDNHEKEWGTRNDYRTGVLAEDLTREAVLDAYRNRRIYATEDQDLILDVRASGFPMGSRVTGVPPVLEVTASDGSGDGFEQVRLLRNGVELESRPVSGGEIDLTFTDPAPTGTDYYYVIVTQTDDGDGNGRNDEAISSPIWIDATP